MESIGFMCMGLHHGDSARVECIVYGDDRPLLAIDDGRQHIALSACPLTGDPEVQVGVTEGHLRFARELVDAAQEYLAELQRISATDRSQAKPAA